MYKGFTIQETQTMDTQ